MFSQNQTTRFSSARAKRAAVIGIAAISTIAVGVPSAFAATAAAAKQPSVAIANMYGYVLVNADHFAPNQKATLNVNYGKTSASKALTMDANGRATISFPAPAYNFRGSATATVTAGSKKATRTETLGKHPATSAEDKDAADLRSDSTSTNAGQNTKATSTTAAKTAAAKATPVAAMHAAQTLDYAGALVSTIKDGTSCKFDFEIGTAKTSKTIVAAHKYAAAVVAVPVGYKGNAVINTTCGTQKFTKTIAVTGPETPKAVVAKAKTPTARKSVSSSKSNNASGSSNSRKPRRVSQGTATTTAPRETAAQHAARIAKEQLADDAAVAQRLKAKAAQDRARQAAPQPSFHGSDCMTSGGQSSSNCRSNPAIPYGRAVPSDDAERARQAERHAAMDYNLK